MAAYDRYGVGIGSVCGLAFFVGEWLSSQKAVVVRGLWIGGCSSSCLVLTFWGGYHSISLEFGNVKILD